MDWFGPWRNVYVFKVRNASWLFFCDKWWTQLKRFLTFPIQTSRNTIGLLLNFSTADLWERNGNVVGLLQDWSLGTQWECFRMARPRMNNASPRIEYGPSCKRIYWHLMRMPLDLSAREPTGTTLECYWTGALRTYRNVKYMWMECSTGTSADHWRLFLLLLQYNTTHRAFGMLHVWHVFPYLVS